MSGKRRRKQHFIPRNIESQPIPTVRNSNPRNVVTLTKQSQIRIIRTVKSYKSIWNKEYSRRMKKDDSDRWKHVAARVDMSVKYCKTQFRNVKTSFNAKIKQAMLHGCNDWVDVNAFVVGKKKNPECPSLILWKTFTWLGKELLKQQQQNTRACQDSPRPAAGELEPSPGPSCGNPGEETRKAEPPKVKKMKLAYLTDPQDENAVKISLDVIKNEPYDVDNDASYMQQGPPLPLKSSVFSQLIFPANQDNTETEDGREEGGEEVHQEGREEVREVGMRQEQESYPGTGIHNVPVDNFEIPSCMGGSQPTTGLQGRRLETVERALDLVVCIANEHDLSFENVVGLLRENRLWKN